MQKQEKKEAAIIYKEAKKERSLKKARKKEKIKKERN